jgi:hypothetical protein
MGFEDDLGRFNEHFFFREFTFSKNTFRPRPEQEVELADNILWLDDLVVVFQLKERIIEGNSSAQEEERWFNRKVITLGTRQIRDTLTYLSSHKQIELENHRGHIFRLEGCRIASLHKIICYFGHDKLPENCRSKKFHKSRTAGVIHLISASDYLQIVRTLLTPPELSEYLAFREKLIRKWEIIVESLPEQALIGQFLEGNVDSRPNMEFLKYLEALEHRIDEWDMSGVIKKFPERVTMGNETNEYYQIVAEIAKLKRSELREFKKRFQLSMDKCQSNLLTEPYRMACPRTNCAFLFIPLVEEFIQHRQQGLQNLTYACKYDLKVEKCIGVSFAPEEEGWYTVEWCYIEFHWEYDAELDYRLKQNNPFRIVQTADLGRYTFLGEE